jgi:hypothetical protein
LTIDCEEFFSASLAEDDVLLRSFFQRRCVLLLSACGRETLPNDSELKFYDWKKELSDWREITQKYFGNRAVAKKKKKKN